MERVRVSINDNDWFLRVAKTEEERQKGLQGVKKLRKGEGMLFIYEEPQDVTFHMKNTHVPLDIIFINEDDEVISVKRGTPESEDPITESDVLYVIEVNKGSGVAAGDEVEFEDEEQNLMQILAPDGSVQYELEGGERICSRKNTKILIRKAKKAQASQSDSDYKALGRYLFKVFKQQNEREPEYVSNPD